MKEWRDLKHWGIDIWGLALTLLPCYEINSTLLRWSLKREAAPLRKSLSTLGTCAWNASSFKYNHSASYSIGFHPKSFSAELYTNQIPRWWRDFLILSLLLDLCSPGQWSTLPIVLLYGCTVFKSVLALDLDQQIGPILAGQFRMVQLATENQCMTELLEIVLPHCLSVSLRIKSGDDGRDLEGRHAPLEELETIEYEKGQIQVELPASTGLKGLKVRGVHIFRYHAPSMRLRPQLTPHWWT